MPIIWRYLLSQYLKVFFLCVVSFIAVLVVARLDDIAEFAGLGAPASVVALFALYQVPYILPIAMPVSCLISAILLFQTLSSTHELTALRACSFSLWRIATPLLFAGALLSLGNFFVTSEMSTASHLASRRLVNEVTTVNPLLLLQKKRFFQLKDAYVSIERLQGNNLAHGVVLVKASRQAGRLSLLTAESLHTDGGTLTGEHVAMVSSTEAQDPLLFDNLFIENQERVTADANECLQILRGGGFRLNPDHLRYPLLLAKKEYDRDALALAVANDAPAGEILRLQGALARTYSEFFRRFSLTLSPFTFTLLGCAFGIKISRGRSNKGVITVILLASFALAAFFMAKSVDRKVAMAATLYILPHALILVSSVWTLQRATKGIE